jgi:hypothetical protein
LRDSKVDTIGNLTLVSEKVNPSLSNASWLGLAPKFIGMMRRSACDIGSPRKASIRARRRSKLCSRFDLGQATRDHPKMSFAETVSMVNFPTMLSTGKGSSIMVPSETMPAGTSCSSWVPILSVLMLMRFSVSCAPLASV